MTAKFFREGQDRNGCAERAHPNSGVSQFIQASQQNIALRAIFVTSVCRTDSRVQRVRLTGGEQSTAAEPYLVATMASQGREQETLERGGGSQGMLNISWAGRHLAW